MDYSRRDFVRTLFIASQATLLGRLAPGSVPTDESSGKALNFVILGDWGRLGRPDQQQVADQMAITAQKTKAAFVISAGDNFYENGVASASDPQWQLSYENVYKAPPLQVPWYVVMGNHDYHGVPDAQLDYAKAHPRWIMPARYYTKVLPIDAQTNVEFFFIDTCSFITSYRVGEKLENPRLRENVLLQDAPAQLKWLDNALAQSKANWKIVVGHHPIYSGGIHGDQPELIEQLLPLLHHYKVPAYFCGHDHDLQHLKAGEVNLFVSGGGSEHRPNHEIPQMEFGKSSSGFMAVSLSKDQMQVQVIDNLGNLLYRTTVFASV